jgi:hypothetical protein
MTLAMLESATEDSQNYPNVGNRKGKLLFSQAGDSLFDRTLNCSFLRKSFLKFESFSPTGGQRSPDFGGCESHE